MISDNQQYINAQSFQQFLTLAEINSYITLQVLKHNSYYICYVQVTADKQKTILIAGGSGLIGQKLVELLKSNKFNVTYLTRKKNADGIKSYHWDPEKKAIDASAITKADVIINLAGEGISNKRWTSGRKRKIINSRIFSTTFLAESLGRIPNNVQLVINASAIGIYGDTGEKIVHEDEKPSSDFLGQTCSRWEAAATAFQKLSIRTVIFRIGLVLATEGGILPTISRPLQFRLAPYFGNGSQYQSWIHINDLCRMIVLAITDENISGTYNAVAPGPLSNKNFMKLMTQILDKWFLVFSIPAVFVKIIMGEMSKLVLDGTRASSEKITDAGFTFTYPQADDALRDLLGK